MNRTCNQIRREFIEFFEQRQHAFVPSSSLLPADDPTLLFANAGMNQFKDIFLGREKRAYTRAVNSQKCIRAGGKHNDLEDVGHDTYHHTFFEMLGNWSFGDYFKTEAISWAWELLTKVWGLDPKRLHATYFQGDQKENLAPDDEARELWLKVLPPERIHPGNKKDNFWEMGDTGPCGPCSEIHYDFTPDFSGGNLVNAGDARVIEIWNNVFMQFNRDESGRLSPLPARHVDTGMGFERICRVLQGVDSNYDIDAFRGIFQATEKLARTGPYTGKLEDIKDIAYRVIADHVRALTFAIADGIIPSNEGRGYVLRRILRRAARYGRQYLGIDEPFLVQLVPTVVSLMGESFPEIAQRQQYVQDTIRSEEESFGKTLDRGIRLFDKQAQQLQSGGGKTLPGKVAFDLEATFGFPIDLTQVMASEQGLGVDLEGYEIEKKRHQEISGAGEQFKAAAIVGLPATDDSAKYDSGPLSATVLGWVVGEEFVTDGELIEGAEAGVVLDKTPFYGEQGGQVGDTGVLSFAGGSFKVNNSVNAGQCVLHYGVMAKGRLKPGMTVTAAVDGARMDIMRNHTATHLLNWALREVLGGHINQAGSVVAADRLRFDFTHNYAVKDEEIEKVETLVNQRILADQAVDAKVMPLGQGKQIPGIRAVFGEKYPDPVRVIMIGATGGKEQATSEAPDNPLDDQTDEFVSPPSAEFCGGTHLSRTSQIGLFKIVGEESVAKGVRRITAVTGSGAFAYVQEQDRVLRAVSQALRTAVGEVPARVEAMQKEIKELKKRPAAAAGGGGSDSEVFFKDADGRIIIMQVATGADPAPMRTLCDNLRQKGAHAVLVGGADADKVTLVAMVDEALVKAGKLKAGDWVNAAAALVDGKGGGKPTLAQAGGKKPEKLPDALAAAKEFIVGKV